MISGFNYRFVRPLAAFLGIALSALLLGLVLPVLTTLPKAIPLHAVFALGIMPLIMGAMTWFTPVLTRTATPGVLALGPPLLALMAGLLLIYSLVYDFPLYSLAAALALLGVFLLSYWMRTRKRRALGSPHPGLLWYRLALAALALGLIAILLGQAWPEYWIELRLIHLHLNTLGFIGLAALGTLRVLLPTVTHLPDDKAAIWLRGGWTWLFIGTLLIAVGSAVSRELSMLGAVLWFLPLARFVGHPLGTHRKALSTLHGAAPALTVAFVGILLTIAGGIGHALSALPAESTTQAFIWGFLLPLVTGAATHLLPLWIDPTNSQVQSKLKNHMEKFGGIRALLFLLAGILAVSGAAWGWILAGMALLQFLLSTAFGLVLSVSHSKLHK